MNRIKNFQMSNGIYNGDNTDKRIVYQSLKWRVEKSIGSFYDNLIEGNISSSIWQYHKITEEDIDKKDENSIVQKLKESINYDDIMSHSPTEDEYKIARSVSTSLWTLKDRQINALIKCASAVPKFRLNFIAWINK